MKAEILDKCCRYIKLEEKMQFSYWHFKKFWCSRGETNSDIVWKKELQWKNIFEQMYKKYKLEVPMRHLTKFLRSVRNGDESFIWEYSEKQGLWVTAKSWLELIVWKGLSEKRWKMIRLYWYQNMNYKEVGGWEMVLKSTWTELWYVFPLDGDGLSQSLDFWQWLWCASA